MPERRFPPPWSVEEEEACFVVRDHNGQALTYVYFEEEPGRRAAAKLLTRDGARRIAAEHRQVAGVAIASGALPNICHRSQTKQSALLNDARALQISSFSLIAPLSVGLALSAVSANAISPRKRRK